MDLRRHVYSINLKNLNINSIIINNIDDINIILPNNMIHLTFGYELNRSIILPKTVTHIVLGNGSSHRFITLLKGDLDINLIGQFILPNNSTYIKFGLKIIIMNLFIK